MRPVRLTMQAFGPYAGREVVDFREAVASSLFGIYGATGSGKSTIFSAMTFALFGEAANPGQETSSLRSDHADPGLPTEVEFVFDVGDRRCVVRRRPEQTRPKQRGTGETRDPHEAWLFDASGISVDEISDANAGKVIAEKKIGAVREAVSDILGYGPAQFRQIVLLPQGKFETFLTASTDVRLAILRELFDVSVYRRLALKFKEDAANVERSIRQEREVCAGRLRAEGFATADLLADGIAAAQIAHGEEAEREAEASQRFDKAREALEAFQRIEEGFQAAENAKAELDALLQRNDEIGRLKERVANARRAQTLVDVESYLRQTEAEVADAVRERDLASQTSADATEASQCAARTLEEERARSNQIDEFRKRAETLDRHLQTLADANDLEQAAREANRILCGAQKAFDAVTRRCSELSEKKGSEQRNLSSAREQEAARHRSMAERTSLEAACKATQDYEKAEMAVEAARAASSRLKSDRAEIVQQATEARARFSEAEANLAAVQALHLAAKLTPGEPCPVCGSNVHPSPATGRIDHEGLDKAFRTAKVAWERSQAEEQKSERLLASAEATQKEREKILSELPSPERPSADLLSEIATLSRKLEAFGSETDIAAAEIALTALDQELVTADAIREQLRGDLEVARGSEAIARDRLEQALGTIPQPLRRRDALDIAIAENRDALEIRQAALNAADKAAISAREAALLAAKDAEAAGQVLRQAELRRDKASDVFQNRLGDLGFSEHFYQSCKPMIATVDADTMAIDAYGKTLEVARSREEAACKSIAGFKRPDLEPLNEALRESEELLRQMTNARAQREAQLNQLRRLQREITEALGRLEETEKETASLRNLSALFNAENAQRLDLETFAIGAMFDQVLIAANLRLNPMTGGRYTLERELEGGGGRSRRGLGIRVFDLYTGKGRPPATLSGGETFIAALALALGLSDIVESVSGKVRLDTIFIDEGFGSLDIENDSGTLDQVLQVLTSLVSQRRSVGLISHVPLVQEAIPNGFYVRKDVRGSHVEARAAI